MLKNISINDCLLSLEGVLNLQYDADLTTAKLLKQTIESLENRYGVSLNKPLYEIQNESQLSANSVDKLLEQITVALQRLALFNQMCYFTKKVPFSLSDMNYLGFSREDLLQYEQYLMDENLYQMHHTDVVNDLMGVLDTITFTYIKRLFMILIVLDKLGVSDGVSIPAVTLYMGTL